MIRTREQLVIGIRTQNLTFLLPKPERNPRNGTQTQPASDLNPEIYSDLQIPRKPDIFGTQTLH